MPITIRRCFFIVFVAFVSSSTNASDLALNGYSLQSYDGRGQGKDYTGVWVNLSGVDDKFGKIGAHRWGFEFSSSYRQPSIFSVGFSSKKSFSGDSEPRSLFANSDRAHGNRYWMYFDSISDSTSQKRLSETVKFIKGLTAPNRRVFETVCKILNNQALAAEILSQMSSEKRQSSEYRSFWGKATRKAQIRAAGDHCSLALARAGSVGAYYGTAITNRSEDSKYHSGGRVEQSISGFSKPPIVETMGVRLEGAHEGSDGGSSLLIDMLHVKVDSKQYLAGNIRFDLLVNKDGLELGLRAPLPGRTVTSAHTVADLSKLKLAAYTTQKITKPDKQFMWVNADYESRYGKQGSELLNKLDGDEYHVVLYILANYDEIVNQAIEYGVSRGKISKERKDQWKAKFAGKANGFVHDGEKILSLYRGNKAQDGDGLPESLPKDQQGSSLATAIAAKEKKPVAPDIDNVEVAFDKLTYEERKAVQTELQRLGFYHSSIDGMYGPSTRGAVHEYLEIAAVEQPEPDQLTRKFASLLSTVAERSAKKLQIASSPSTDNPASRGEVAKPLASSGTPQDQLPAVKLDDNFILGDVEGFVSTAPGALDALKLASLYLPAKREAERGERGAKFESLKAFVLENRDFVVYAVEQTKSRGLKQQQKIEKQLRYIKEQLGKLQAEIAEAPLSERALSLYTLIDKYRSIDGSLEGQIILAAASALRADLAAIDMSGEGVSQPSNDVAESAELSASEQNKSMMEVKSSSCDTDPRICSVAQLCDKATSFESGKLDWDSSEHGLIYVEFAKRFGMSCGLTSSDSVASKQITEKAKPKAQISKYKNRKALVVGNANYSNQEPLKNPINDAKAVSEKLREVGFEVTYRENLGVRDFGRALSDFETSLNGSDISLFYYAGHGIEIDKQNYLIPVDANIRSTGDVRYETVSLDDALDVALNTSKLSMVLIDACRDNPFAGQMRDRTRSVGRGLSVIEVNSGPVYQIVSFAASSGQVAEDGDGQNSPYASVLVDLLDEPNLEVGKMFRILGDRVSQLTNGAQQPTKRDNLRGEDIFLVNN